MDSNPGLPGMAPTGSLGIYRLLESNLLHHRWLRAMMNPAVGFIEINEWLPGLALLGASDSSRLHCECDTAWRIWTEVQCSTDRVIHRLDGNRVLACGIPRNQRHLEKVITLGINRLPRGGVFLRRGAVGVGDVGVGLECQVTALAGCAAVLRTPGGCHRMRCMECRPCGDEVDGSGWR